MRVILPSAALALLVAAGCRSRDIVRGVPDSTFVATIAELRRVPQLAPADSGRRQTLRDSIMRVHRVTREQLDAAARTLAERPSRAKSVWDAIDAKSGVSSANTTTTTTLVAPVPSAPVAATTAVPPGTLPPGAGVAAAAAHRPDSGVVPLPKTAIKMQSVGVNAAVPKKEPTKP